MPRRWIVPRRWRPPAVRDAGPTGAFVVARRLATGGRGPEDVMFDASGAVVTGTGDGRLLRLGPAGSHTVVADTGGRPLGVQPCPDGSVLVCDHDRGLLRVAADGTVEVLVDTVDGAPLRFASNVVQGRDGTIW